MRRDIVFAAWLMALGLFGIAPAYGQADAGPGPSRSIDIASHIAEASHRFGLPESWIYAVMRTESAGRIGAVSSAGAMGLMQLMPGTWERQRSRFGLSADPFDPRDNIMAGTSYLREMYDLYGSAGFLAAYNAGPGRYEQWQKRGRPLPAETRAYVAKIAAILQPGNAPLGAANATAAQSVRISWTQSKPFAARSNSNWASPTADTDEAVTALSPASPRLRGGLFAPVSGSRVP